MKLLPEECRTSLKKIRYSLLRRSDFLPPVRVKKLHKLGYASECVDHGQDQQENRLTDDDTWSTAEEGKYAGESEVDIGEDSAAGDGQHKEMDRDRESGINEFQYVAKTLIEVNINDTTALLIKGQNAKNIKRRGTEKD
ncbi:hypothetical protein BWQ96_09300 [Gracilariopsis chorda]|uniref:Uncharacterized protein n=1 Tax=Gracilariopsis chorda TaxID=448386 RepID=A0A2V3IFY6_9FLOR|nr:hypothetical protein BWQ96_09300 [Gracilariopsis chorda]|eukprot:PXF41005.1 hypothetical protein BWQ96_09300 [Gracilariopsis chorda]